MQFSFAQEKTVTGVVSDATGPLPGANIVVKGTTRSAQTDFDGKFSIKAKPGEILVISFTGYIDTNVTVGTSNTVNVKMQEGIILSEVVVKADFGYMKKDIEKISAGVSTISSEELNRQNPVVNVQNMLQGKAAGVQVTGANGKPGAPAYVSVRGSVSITGGDASAIYVVDGVFVSSDEFSTISASDIENVTVLKDGVAAALYGIRGGNGVVVVTTKRGKNQKTKFEITNSIGYTEKVKDPFRMMNAAEKIRYENEVLGTGPSVGDSPEQLALKLSYDQNWQDTLLRNGSLQNFNFTVSGGNDKIQNYFSLGYSSDTGIIRNLDGYNRITGRFNSDFQATDYLKIGFNVSGAYEKNNNPRDRNNVQNPFRAMYDYNPYETVYARDDQGNIIYDVNGNPEWNIPIAGFNIAEAIINNTDQTRFFRIYGRPYLELKLIKNLTFTTRFGINYERRQREAFTKPNSILDQIVGDPNARGQKTDAGWDNLDFQWTNLINYQFKVKEKHNFDLTGMYEYQKTNFRNYSLTRKGFVNGELPTAGTAVVGVPFTGRTENATISYFGQLDYDYDGKYLLTVVGRNDGSSRLGDDKWEDAYGVSAGWVLSKDLFNNNNIVNFLKLRASYGELNSTAGVGSYDAVSLFNSTSYANATATNLTSGNAANTKLGFEQAKKQDYGIEARFFKNRLNLGASYFYDLRENFIYDDYLPATGWNSTINAGKWVAKGFELELRGAVIKSENVNLTLYANVGKFDREVLALARPNNPDDRLIRGLTVNQVGYQPDEYFLTRYAGVDPTNGHALYYKLDGSVTDVYSDDDNVMTGKSPYAKYEGGFGAEFNFKGFSVAADFTFKQGNYVYNYMWFNLNNDGSDDGVNQAVDQFNYWTPTNTNAENPAPLQQTGIDSNEVSDRFLQDASFIRFRSLNIGYTFDKSVLGKLPIDKVRIFTQMQNLAVWTKFKGDPEVGIGCGESQTALLVPGQFALYSYPNVRSFSFGLTVNF
jgi:TonB-linked SusC/RagA family outer membrane protein